jgi:c-di-GMP-binding flagellar brake protein YcgR
MQLARNLAHVRVHGHGALVTRVLEHEDELIVISPPTSELETAELRVSDPVDLGLVTTEGVRWASGVVLEVEQTPAPRVHVRLVSEPLQAERRQSPRAPEALAVDLARPGAEPIRGKLVDVSSGGLRIEAPLSVAQGENVQLSVHVPDDEPIRGTAEVVHVEPRDAGFRFKLVTADDRQRLVRRAFERLARS